MHYPQSIDNPKMITLNPGTNTERAALKINPRIATNCTMEEEEELCKWSLLLELIHCLDVGWAAWGQIPGESLSAVNLHATWVHSSPQVFSTRFFFLCHLKREGRGNHGDNLTNRWFVIISANRNQRPWSFNGHHHHLLHGLLPLFSW